MPIQSEGRDLNELRKILGKPLKNASSPKTPTPDGKDLNELRKILGKPLKQESAVSELNRHGIDATNNDEYTYGERAIQGARALSGDIGDTIENVTGANTGFMNALTYPIAAGIEGARKIAGKQPKEVSSWQSKKVPAGSFRKKLSEPFDKVAGRNLKASPDDLTGQLIEGGSEFLNPFGSGITKIAKQGIKPLFKALGADILTGAGVGGARYIAGEGNQDVANLVGGLGIPLGVSSIKLLATRNSRAQQKVENYLRDRVGEEEIPNVLAAIERNNNPDNFVEGYQPTLSEVADNPILSGIERTFAGQTTSPEFGKLSNRTMEQNQAILKKLNELVPENYNAQQAQDFIRTQYDDLLETAARVEELAGAEAAQRVLDDFARRETIQEAGRNVQRRVGNEIVEPLVQTRRENSAADYRQLADTPERREPLLGMRYINDELRNASGDIRSVLERLGRDLEHTRDNEYIGRGADIERLPTRVGEIVGVQQNIRRLLKKEPHGSPLSAKLTTLLNHLDRDLESFPLARQATENFARDSDRINAFEEHPAIGKDIARDVLNRFTKNEDKVINKYLKGHSSGEYARDLYPHIRDDRRTMDAIEGHINSRFIKEVVNTNTGRVDPNKLNHFRKEYTGAFVLYPGLDIKLENSSNATKMYNDIVKSNAQKIKAYQKNAAYQFLKKDPGKVISGVLDSKNNKSNMQMEEIVSELAKDETGVSRLGLQRSGAEHMMNNFRTLGEGNTSISIKKFNDMIVDKSEALGKLYDKDQMENLQKIHNSLMARNKKLTVGKTDGSASAPKLGTMMDILVNQAGSDVSKATGNGLMFKLGNLGLKKLSDYRNKKYNEIMVKTFLDPEFGKVMFTNIKNKKPKEIEALMSNYLKRSALRTTNMLNREEEED